MKTLHYTEPDTMILDCRQAANHLSVSVKTIRRWAQTGKLHGHKVGNRGDWRFTKKQLDSLVHTKKNILEQSDAIFSLSFSSSPVAMTIVRASDGVIVDANDLYQDLMNLDRTELIGRTITEISGTKGQEATRELLNLRKTRYSDKRTEFKKDIVIKSGDVRRIRGAFVAVKINGEKHIITSHADATDRERASDNNRYLAVLTHNIIDAVIGVDKHAHVVSWNKGAEKLYGWKEHEVVGKELVKVLDTKLVNTNLNIHEVREVIAKEGSWRGESLHRHRDGTPINILSTVAAIYNDAGEHTGSVAVYHDISHRKRAEQALREREERYRVLFDSIVAGFCIVELLFDEQGKPYDYRYIEANSAYEELTEFPNVQGKTIRQLVPTLPQSHIDKVAHVIATGQDDRSIDYWDKRNRWYDVHTMRVGEPGGNVAALLVRDITEIRTIEEEKAASMKKVINTLESIGEGFIQIDADRNVVMVNKTFLRLTRMSRGDILGQNLDDIFNDDGHSLGFHYKELFGDIMPKKPMQFFDFYNKPLGMWMEIRAYPTDDGMSIFVRDSTKEKMAAEKQAELKRLSHEREQLIKINRAKDEFIGIASHQLRTPATGVKQYIGMMLEGFSGDISESQRKMLAMAYASNERQIKLINDLLKTAQMDASSYTLMRSSHNIASLLQDAVDAQQPQFNERKQTVVVNDLSDGVRANVDPTEIDLVFSNLLENACKYSPEKSTITITLRRNTKTLEIAIADCGIGIEDADRQRIFDKFTRANNIQASDHVSGTGFGLYWVKQIVEMHNGTVTVAPNHPKGSVFTVTLPL